MLSACTGRAGRLCQRRNALGGPRRRMQRYEWGWGVSLTSRCSMSLLSFLCRFRPSPAAAGAATETRGCRKLASSAFSSAVSCLAIIVTSAARPSAGTRLKNASSFFSNSDADSPPAVHHTLHRVPPRAPQRCHDVVGLEQRVRDAGGRQNQRGSPCAVVSIFTRLHANGELRQEQS